MPDFYDKDGNPLSEKEIEKLISCRKTNKKRELFISTSKEVESSVNNAMRSKHIFSLQDAKDLVIYVKMVFERDR